MHPKEDAIYLISYPRSGSTWFRYCFEFITKRKSEPPRNENKTWTEESGASYPELLFHTHKASDEEYNFHPEAKRNIILLLRNYKEALFSNMINEFERLEKSSNWKQVETPWASGVEDSVSHYLIPGMPTSRYPQSPRIKKMIAQHLFETDDMRNKVELMLRYKVSWHHQFLFHVGQYQSLVELYEKNIVYSPSTSHLIRYEDLKQDLSSVLLNLIDYIDSLEIDGILSKDEMRENLNELVANIDHHKAVCLQKYKKTGNLALSYDKGLTYYSSLHAKNFLHKIDNLLVKSFGPKLYKKYLMRYSEGDE